jgi:hypothetical protein
VPGGSLLAGGLLGAGLAAGSVTRTFFGEAFFVALEVVLCNHNKISAVVRMLKSNLYQQTFSTAAAGFLAAGAVLDATLVFLAAGVLVLGFPVASAFAGTVFLAAVI